MFELGNLNVVLINDFEGFESWIGLCTVTANTGYTVRLYGCLPVRSLKSIFRRPSTVLIVSFTAVVLVRRMVAQPYEDSREGSAGTVSRLRSSFERQDMSRPNHAK